MTPPDGAMLEATSAETPAADPMDTFTLDDIQGNDAEPSEFQIPEENILGGASRKAKEDVEVADPEDGPKDIKDGEVAGRGKDGKFAKKGEATEPTEAKPAEAIPFRFRAMGQTHDLEGAQLTDKGDLIVPAAKVGDIREAMNALHVLKEGTLPKLTHLETENTRLTRELTTTKEGRTLAEHKADQMVKGLETLFTDPDEAAAAEKFFKMRDDYPRLRAASETEYWKTQATRSTKPAETPAARAAAPKDPIVGVLPSREEAVSTTKGHLEGYKVEHMYRDIPEADWKQFEASVDRTPLAFIRAATPQDAKQFGVTVGEAVYDTDLLHAAVTEFVTSKRQSRETAETKANRAADNARRTAPKVNAPPVPGSTRTPPKSGSTSAIQSKDDFNNWLDSDEI